MTTHYVGDDCPGEHRDEACQECGGYATYALGNGVYAPCHRCNGTGIEPKEEPR